MLQRRDVLFWSHESHMAVRTHQIKRVVFEAGSARGLVPWKLTKSQTMSHTTRLEAFGGLTVDVYLPVEVAQAPVIVCTIGQLKPGQAIPPRTRPADPAP